MAVSVSVSSEGVRAPLGRDRVLALVRAVAQADKVRDAMISVTFVDSKFMTRLNRVHLGHAGSTDVISFAFREPVGSGVIVGDVYICPDVAREHAARLGLSVREETARLVVHGTLHVLGHEHPDGAGRTHSPMWVKQERLLQRLYSRARQSR